MKRTRDGLKVAFAGVSLALFARQAAAQAFLPPPGEGNVAVTYQDTFARGHLDSRGQLSGDDTVRAHSLAWDVEFGVKDRLAVTASLPFIATRYKGPDPHPVGINGQPSDLDNGTYHGALQDFRFGLRFNVLPRPLAITPFAEAVIPSHHYESLGHSAFGLDLRALVVGVTVGGFADAVLPGTYFQTQLSHAVVQEVLGIRPNRSRVDSEVGYFVTPRFAIRFLESLQVTHDGLEVLFSGDGVFLGALVHGRDYRELPPSFDLVGLDLNHDRVARLNFLNLGGGVAFAVNDSLEVFAAGSKVVWGEGIHPNQGVSVGANWHFRMRGGNLQASPHQTRRVGPLR